jgi:transposase
MGPKRHIITDTLGLMLFVTIHAASIQDRDGAVDRIKAIRCRFSWLRHLFADGGYAGDKLIGALQGHGQWTLEIVRRCDTAKGFVLLPRRWVSSAPSPGSADADASPRTGKGLSRVPPRGPPSPTSAASHASSQAIARPHELLSQALNGMQFLR